MIIIFAEPDDVHALVVANRLVRDMGRDVALLNAADYPTKWSIDFIVGQRTEFTIKADSKRINSSQVEGVWRRRLKRHDVDPAVSDVAARRFCLSESSSFFSGLLDSIDNVVNTERSDTLASRKSYQLKTAAEVGLRIPDTLISSDPAEIMAFYDKHRGNIIFKVLTATDFQFSETRTLEKDHLQFIGSATFAPTIYQEKVVPCEHLRITVTDGDMFCASISTDKEYATMDWRLDPDPTIRAVEPPSEVAELLRKLMDRLGLRYGAIDMIVTQGGECVFLEVNPGGQYLFVEIATGQPISAALARALCSNPKRAVDHSESAMAADV